jgi:hypothetical protein
MRLVHDQHALRQAEQAESRMPGRQYAKQRLIDRSKPHIGKECPTPIGGNPGRALGACGFAGSIFGSGVITGRHWQDRLLESLVQAAAAMRQYQGWYFIIIEQGTISVSKPLVNRVCGRHRRQCYEYAPPMPQRHHAMGQQQRGLGFPRAGLILYHHQRRTFGRQSQTDR